MGIALTHDGSLSPDPPRLSAGRAFTVSFMPLTFVVAHQAPSSGSNPLPSLRDASDLGTAHPAPTPASAGRASSLEELRGVLRAMLDLMNQRRLQGSSRLGSDTAHASERLLSCRESAVRRQQTNILCPVETTRTEGLRTPSLDSHRDTPSRAARVVPSQGDALPRKRGRSSPRDTSGRLLQPEFQRGAPGPRLDSVGKSRPESLVIHVTRPASPDPRPPAAAASRPRT